MNNNEIDPFTSERILDAASRGQGIEGFDELGELFAAVHQPVTAAEAVTTLPPQAITPAPNVHNIGRFTRRTAVTATAAMFALTGVAAALTGGTPAIGPVGGGHRPAVVDDTPADDAPAAEGAGIAAETSDEFTPVIDVSGVIATDGLSDDELLLLCDAAGNHGEYVSQVAHDRVTDVPFGPRVSEAAQTECGKPDVGVDSDTDAADVADDSPGQSGEHSQADEDHGQGFDNSQGHSQAGGEHIPESAGEHSQAGGEHIPESAGEHSQAGGEHIPESAGDNIPESAGDNSQAGGDNIPESAGD